MIMQGVWFKFADLIEFYAKIRAQVGGDKTEKTYACSGGPWLLFLLAWLRQD
jgi:hypothetical protein